MNILGNRLIAVLVGLALLAAPLFSWQFLCITPKTSVANPRRVLWSIRSLRWAAIIFGLVLFLIALLGDAFHNFIFYALGLGGFSAGLAPTERWLKERLDHPI